MVTLYPHEKKSNLELYLNDVYEKECVFKIEKEEIEFIQTGIETLVQDLVDTILEDDSTNKLLSDWIDDSSTLPKELYNEMSIAEIYFPIQRGSSLQKYLTENGNKQNTVKSTIIKVGSFYDGTKNNFPDEFDFICPLLGVRTPLYLPYNLSAHFENRICKHAKHKHYTSPRENHIVKRKLKFNKYKGIHGPAYKLQFIYSNGFGEQRHIHVDLVPALRIVDSNTLQWFVEQVRTNVEPEIFCEEILAAGSSLLVRDNVAFTEIEQHFMKNILLEKHVKVYRILKYLLNGHDDGEKFEEQFSDYLHYTSYRIKILIIYHHEACTHTDTEDLGPCVLQVLEEMSKYENTEGFPIFTSTLSVNYRRRFQVLPYLKSTIDTLQSMHDLKYSYCYDNDKIKSVSGQYLDSCCIRDQNEYIRTRRCCVLS